MARRRKGRAINGIVLVDKDTGLSSNGVLIKVRAIYQAQKAGHTGALDPLATGLLPMCLGEATKFSQFLLDTDKRYTVEAKLGERTDTSDSDGEVVETRPIDVSLEQLTQAISTFVGDIMQIPSMYSALKYQGQPLYKYAREGIEVPREARPITIFSADLLSFEGDRVRMDVHCSKGTYIRTLVDDLGELLGCGAHVTMLHRTKVGPFSIDNAISVDALNELVAEAKSKQIEQSELLDPLLLPMDAGLTELPDVTLDAKQTHSITHGQPVMVLPAPASSPCKLLSGDEQEFIGIGELNDDGMVAPKRLVIKSE